MRMPWLSLSAEDPLPGRADDDPATVIGNCVHRAVGDRISCPTQAEDAHHAHDDDEVLTRRAEQREPLHAAVRFIIDIQQSIAIKLRSMWIVQLVCSRSSNA